MLPQIDHIAHLPINLSVSGNFQIPPIDRRLSSAPRTRRFPLRRAFREPSRGPATPASRQRKRPKAFIKSDPTPTHVYDRVNPRRIKIRASRQKQPAGGWWRRPSRFPRRQFPRGSAAIIFRIDRRPSNKGRPLAWNADCVLVCVSPLAFPRKSGVMRARGGCVDRIAALDDFSERGRWTVGYKMAAPGVRWSRAENGVR